MKSMAKKRDALFKKSSLLIWILGLALLRPLQPAFATGYFGRFISGGYFSDENYSNNSSGLLNNNYSSFSNRLFFRATDIDKSGVESTLDIRDKNDFFDKLDSENLTLTPVNKFQAYQLNLRIPNETSGFYGTLGRFSLAENGGEFTDGVQAGYHLTPSVEAYAFGGLNPKRPDQMYVGFNSSSTNLGFGSVYQPKSSSWLNNTYWANAIVAENVEGHMDRLYLYNNLVYSWLEPSQIVALMYLDFVPDVYIQTALFSYHQKMGNHWSGSANLTIIDVLQYQRSQMLLEQLPSSPYKELSFNARREMSPTTFFDINLIEGVRTIDSLHKGEVSAGPSWSRLWADHANFKDLFGIRKNFTSQDYFNQAVWTYFSKNWEIDLNLSYTLNTQNGSTGTLHQWQSEASFTRYFSKDFFGTFEIEQGMDERLTIWGGFLKISYNFGERNTSPIRSTAPVPLPPPPEGRVY